MKKNFLTIIFFAFCVIFAQEESADILETPQDMETDALILDFLPESDPKLESETEEIPTDNEILETSKKVSWYISASPLMGVDNIQKEYAQFLKRRADTLFNRIRNKEKNSHLAPKWFQPAAASGASFNFETGLSLNIDEKYAVTIGGGYSLNRMKSVYAIENFDDSSQVFKAISVLANNTFSVSTTFKAVFDTSYFSIKGVDAAGFYGGAKFLYSLYLERDTISSRFDEFADNRRESYAGFGAGASVGLFARKKFGKRSLFEYSIGYLFSAVKGYDDFWDRKFYWENAQKSGEILSISNLMTISIALFF